MYNSDFSIYLSEKTDIDLATIEELFEKEVDPFRVAFLLVEKYGADEGKLGKIWGDYLGYAYVDPNKCIVNQEYIQKIGVEFVTKYKALPLYKFGKAVTVSTPNPQNPYIQDRMEKELKEIVSFVFCFPFDIDIYLQLNNLIKKEGKY